MTSIPAIDEYGPNDREALSALFDGELDGDAARFALKRLSHDAQWRRACGSWQLCGDALRGQAAGIAAPDFADRVAAALAAEAATAKAAAPATAPASRRGWIGGALAASVAVAALFVARPFSSDGAPDAGAPQSQVASADSAGATPLAPQPQSPEQQAAGLGAAAVAVAEVPRRIAERRSSRGQSQRAALRRQAQTQAVAAQPAVEVAAASAAGATANPFRPQHSDAPSRPWPRAALPNYPATGGFTASYGSSSASARSFYPFEPSATDAAPVQPPPAPEPESRMPQP